jgi:NADPH:quinone reductase-like Zn-dependent oxidoreductase/acyl carrier protein
VARLSRGERILIHSASGGTGLAAIQYARAVGAEIFATAGSEEKRSFLRSLGVEHVMDSRTLAFADEIMSRTEGRGVDVVLNSLAGEALVKSMEALAPYGRFVEIGKKDIYENSRIGLSPFRKCLSYTAIDMAGMATEKPELFAALLREVVDRFEDGTFAPLPVQAFGANEAQDAFRLMAQAKHTGKIAIRMNDPEVSIAARAAHRGDLVADGSYLITGGLGGLGLTLASWMVSKGARHLALLGRSAPSAAAQEAIRALERTGAEVNVLRGDVSHPADVEGALGSMKERMPPLRGVVHAAAVLDDRTLLEIGEKQFWAPFPPKAVGAWNLHVATRGLPLDFFVMYSSITVLLGSAGQSNYVAANAFLDALAHARRAEGLPATSIQWGPFAEVGLAAAQDNRGQRLSFQGIESFTPGEGVELFSRLLLHPRAEVGLVRLSMRQWLDSHPQASGMRFLTGLENEKAQSRGTKAGSFREVLDRATPAERAPLIEGHVVEQLGRVLRLDPSRIDRRAPFTTLGVDSLLSMELRNQLEASLGLRLSAALLFTYPNPVALADYLLTSIEPASSPVLVPAPMAATTSRDDLEQLGVEDLLAMADEELSLARRNEKAP